MAGRYAGRCDSLLLLHLVDDLPRLLARVHGPGGFFRRGTHKIQEATRGVGFEVVRTVTHRDDIVLEDGAAMGPLLGSIGGSASRGLRTDVVPPPAIERKFTLVWARKAPTR